ncbi:hypothetical protein MOQ_003907 [Trypanosoma cruzi marinkellei]|uniref:Uncharacterized protein n=1 Tax=Trypanosoma cruzi marinkellei TaxID=85056 RepID=K2NBI8_TRYCR|nr:hypothetical protein MOQ_003907 [Trypanosoma cruzi marinkellei]
MRRQMYTKEELIALREALALETFADPVPLDCPMRTDSDLTLHQTTVRKSNKEDWKVMSFSKRISAFNGTVEENNVTTRPDIHRSSFGEASITLCRPNRAEEYTDCDDRGCKVIMPPRLQIPIVTIDPMRKHPNASSRDYKNKAEVNIDMERKMVARLRLRQQRQPTKKKFTESREKQSRYEEVPDSHVVFATSSPPKIGDASRGAFVHSAQPKGLGSSTVPPQEVGSAVSISNVSLFNSMLGSRYLGFTRSMGLWHYLSKTFDGKYLHVLDDTADTGPSNGGANSSSIRCNHNGNASSIGPDDSGTTPAGEEKSGSEQVDETQGSSEVLKKGGPIGGGRIGRMRKSGWSVN